MSKLAVRYRADAKPEDVARLEGKLGITPVRRIVPLRVSAYNDRPGLFEALQQEPIVEYVEHEEQLSTR